MSHYICVNPYISPGSFVQKGGSTLSSSFFMTSKIPMMTNSAALLGTANDGSLGIGMTIFTPAYASTPNLVYTVHINNLQRNNRGIVTLLFLGGAGNDNPTYIMGGDNAITTIRTYVEGATTQFFMTNGTNNSISVYLEVGPGSLKEIPNIVSGNVQASEVLI